MIRGTPYAHARGIEEILRREAKLIERLMANMPRHEPDRAVDDEQP